MELGFPWPPQNWLETCSRLNPRAKSDNFIQNHIRDVSFSHQRHMDRGFAIAADYCHFISNRIKPNAILSHIVGDDRIEILRGQLFARIPEDVLSFRGKPDDQQSVLVCICYFAQYIWRPF